MEKKKSSLQSTIAAILFLGAVLVLMGAPAYDMISGIMAVQQQVSAP